MSVNNDIISRKKALRAHARSIRAAFTKQEKDEYDRLIANAVISLQEYKESSVIFIYISGDIEVSTAAIIRHALNAGKTVAAPRCIPEARQMEFFKINSLSELQAGHYGISEPNPHICEKITDLSDGLCIVPALSFDGEGFRLGFGMGYYDRFLSQFTGTSAGICYCKNICDKLPRDLYDRKVDILITEKHIKRF